MEGLVLVLHTLLVSFLLNRGLMLWLGASSYLFALHFHVTLDELKVRDLSTNFSVMLKYENVRAPCYIVYEAKLIT